MVATRREAIVRQFAERARRELREALPRSSLVDSIPRMLDALVDLLRAAPPAHAPEESPRVSAIAWAHGAERAAAEVDVVQLIWEYGVLRDILLDEAERAGAELSVRDVRVLTEVITTAIAESVRKFTADRASALRRTEARFLAIADHAPAAFVIKSAEGRLVFVNRFACESLGRKRAELVGQLDRDVLPPPQAARQAETDARALAGETVDFRDVLASPRGPRAFYVVKFRLPGGPGRPPEIAVIGLDVTELEAARATVHHADELLELGDAFFELDRDWRYVRVNRNQERLSGRTREQTIGRVFWDLWPEAARPDHPYWIEYHRVMEERVPREFDAYFAPRDLWTGVTAYPVSDGGIAVFFRDATRRKKVEERLRQMQEFEQQLIGIVSHDLRNPLNVVLLGSAALLTRGQLSDQDAGAVRRIRSSAQRAARLINDLLDVTRARLGEPLALRLAEVDLAPVARQVLEELRSLHPDHELRLEAAGDTRGRWDPDRVAQVIENLVANAVKYGQPWTPVTVRLAAGEDEILVAVNNRGEPIPAEAQRTIFEPGARAANGDPTGRSVGLGLFIVERITAAHGGRVEVTSSAEDGTTFT
ncbi:MAG TPA: PAS domain-containing sensor histidine kinase, partial [Anaeromyxobacteraceae bacterium]|nr:PAS domain-containing sensor histidine kinase [Anaeromyxobacteraceae bacterium]